MLNNQIKVTQNIESNVSNDYIIKNSPIITELLDKEYQNHLERLKFNDKSIEEFKPLTQEEAAKMIAEIKDLPNQIWQEKLNCINEEKYNSLKIIMENF